jgi:glyoxylase-like metal-dependent hydrolase (beta-lactamase superfamily II)
MAHTVRRHRWIVLALVTGLGLTALIAANIARLQAQDAGRPAGSTYVGKAFTFNEVVPGVYHAVGTGNLAVGCNASVIVNADDVMVIDTNLSPGAAWALREELKALTPKPVRYVVNTHWHWDHAHGNQIYGPDVTVISHEYTRAKLAAGDSMKGRSYEMFITTGLPSRIADLKAKLAAAPAADRAALESQLAIAETQLAGSKVLVPTPPTLTFTDHLTLVRGGREIRLLYLGRAHTGGDIVVFLPKERVVITGDLLVEGTSYIGDGFTADWPATLEKLRALDFDVTLPGHGTVFRGKTKIDHFEAYLRDFRQQAEAFHEAGVSAQDAAAKMDMRKHAANYPALTTPGVLWHGVARVYEELDGKAR